VDNNTSLDLGPILDLNPQAVENENRSMDPGSFHALKQQVVEEFERRYLVRILGESGMNLSRASRCSGLSRKHIRTLMAKYGMAR
jgi:DNA-binding NtrC family response regulator